MLTDRENDIVVELRRGLSNRMIGEELGIAEATVKVYMQRIMRKLECSNRAQVILATSFVTPRKRLSTFAGVE